MARAYGVFASGGQELQLQTETLRALSAPAVPSENGFYDDCMKGEMRYSLGFFKPGPTLPFGHPESFGAPGAGDSFGFSDPVAGIGYAYRRGAQNGDTLNGNSKPARVKREAAVPLCHDQ